MGSLHLNPESYKYIFRTFRVIKNTDLTPGTGLGCFQSSEDVVFLIQIKRLWTFHTIKLNYVICKTSYFRKNTYFLEWGSNPRSNISSGQKYKNIFVRFLVQVKTVEFAFEINWPLAMLNGRKHIGFFLLSMYRVKKFMENQHFFDHSSRIGMRGKSCHL